MFSGARLNSAWKMLVKPERQGYALDNLGPSIIHHENGIVIRKDFYLINSVGLKLTVSLYHPCAEGGKDTSLRLNCPCVIYAHSQSGNRLEGLFLLDFCVERGYGLCLFDFAGCGRAQGNYVTLGWREQEDLAQLVDVLARDFSATQIAIWGRSMGAATALFYAQRSSVLLAAIVVDSPFSDVTVMIQDLAANRLMLPAFLVNIILGYFSRIIVRKVGIDVLQLKPLEVCKECKVPALFVLGEADRLVLPFRVKQMFDIYGGKPKSLARSEGEHSSEREAEIIAQGLNLIENEFKKNAAIAPASTPSLPRSRNFVHKLQDDVMSYYAREFEEKLIVVQKPSRAFPRDTFSRPTQITFSAGEDIMGEFSQSTSEAELEEGEEAVSDLENFSAFDHYNIESELDSLKNSIRVHPQERHKF